MKRTGDENRVTSEKAVKRTLGKTTIIFGVLFILGVIGIVVVLLFVNKATALVLQEETYQYFGTTPTEHSIGTSLSNSEMSTIMIENKVNVGVEDTPLYSTSGNALYLPESYSCYAVDTNEIFRIPEFMKLTKRENSEIIECTFNDEYYEITHGFLFDGGINYIFLDEGQIVVNEMNRYPVSKFSFFSMDYGMFRIYNHTDNEFIDLERDTTNVVYRSFSGYSIDLYTGAYKDRTGQESLLVASPSLLSPISER